MKKRILAIIIAPMLGAILGYLLVVMLTNGWFSSEWQMIAKPPEKGLRLVALSQDSLWVQSDSGVIYYNENSSTCKSDCWREVSEIPTLPIIKTDDTTVTDEACAPPPPLSRVTNRISECWRTMWVDHNFTFALRKDGTIHLWEVNVYKEWSVVILFTGICVGAMTLLIPALVTVLVLSILDRRSKRALIST